jgi:ankyrin repeat protein
MSHHHHKEGEPCDDHICNHFGNSVATQSLEELEFQRSLCNASRSGDIERVKMLLQRNDPNMKDEAGYTPLHYAARSGHLEICKLLLSKGAKVNAMVRIE